ncbi:hypothetical protein BaRGS_00001420 [Batillaria attramentaria]|uniref:Uncharacterized protein n=1 Tax=Batillaria attramentaria TaxID=370345 RepID=A0ABD0M6A1_9CAEN
MSQDMETDASNGRHIDFRRVVLKMDNELHDEDVESLKFLCQGLVITSKLNRVKEAHELVEELQSAGVVSERDYFLLADLLQYIGRVDIVEAINYEEQEVLRYRRQNRSHIKPFYVLLFRIAEELTDEDVKKAVFMYGKVPNKKNVSNGMDLFTIMCQHNVINPDNIGLLVQIFQSLERNDVVELVRRYSVTQGESVIRDLEQQFVRSMQLRGQDVSGMFGPTAVHGKGLGPRDDDLDLRKSKSSQSSDPPSGHTSMVNNPSIPLTPVSFNPADNTRPSAPQNSTPQASDNMSNIAPGPQTQTVPAQTNTTAIAPAVLLESGDRYWQEFCVQLGVHFFTTGRAVDTVNGDKLYKRNLALLKRWLDSPDTRMQDEVQVRMALVRALAKAGPELMAGEIAQELNIDPLGDSGDVQVAPVAHQLQHLSIATVSPIPHYQMAAIPRGICVIINNRDFYKDQRFPEAKLMISREGTDVDRGFDIQMDAAMEKDELQTDSPGELIPNEADFLLGYATVPGFVSYRSKTRGSWYITKLTEMLRKYAFDHDILDILTLVNYEVGKGDANMDGGTFKQSPAPMYSLRKKLIFSRPVQFDSVSMRSGMGMAM